MYKIVILFVVNCLITLCSSAPADAAWPWSSRQDLVKINDIAYTQEDYIHWRENQLENSKDKNLLQDIKPFIEWKLLVQEGMNMELDQSPGLLRKNEVYRRFRTRMQFKHENVNSKIKIDEQDLKTRFEADYNPVTYITFLYFRNGEKAEQARQQLSSGAASFDELKDRPEEEGGPHQSRQKQYYPYQLAENSNLKSIIDWLEEGAISDVYTMGNFSVVVHLDKMEAPDEGLYKVKKKEINRLLAKEQSGKLTKDLIDTLWKKYEVEVDEELFIQAGPDMEGEILKQPIVRTNKVDIPLFLLVKDIRKEHSLRKVVDWSQESQANLYRGLLNGMIIEYLFTWESSDRHYEEEPPLKWVFAYKEEKNLIKVLERQLLEPRVSLSEDEIMQHYLTHADKYKGEDLVSVTSLAAELDLVGKIWQEISRGGDFIEVANKYELNLSAQKDIALEKLSPKFRTAIQSLEEGEVAEPFEVENGRYTLLKLLDRKKGELQPLESVKDGIIKKLKPGKFQKLRGEYIKKLIEFSEIDVNRAAWDKLVTE